MNTEINQNVASYGLYDKDTIIGFCAVIHQPHSINKRIKRVSRIVILPDYQGCGLGTKFLNSVAVMYHNKGYDFSITTSAKNMISALNRNRHWALVRYSRSIQPEVKKKTGYGYGDLGKSVRSNCKTAAFYYKG